MVRGSHSLLTIMAADLFFPRPHGFSDLEYIYIYIHLYNTIQDTLNLTSLH